MTRKNLIKHIKDSVDRGDILTVNSQKYIDILNSERFQKLDSVGKWLVSLYLKGSVEYNGIYFHSEGAEIRLIYYNSPNAEVNLKDAVDIIDTCAFAFCDWVKTIKAESAKLIEYKSFEGVTANKIELPSVIQIGVSAFVNSKIETLKLDSLIEVNQYAFNQSVIDELYAPNITDVHEGGFLDAEIVSLYAPNIYRIDFGGFFAAHIKNPVVLSHATVFGRHSFRYSKGLRLRLSRRILVALYDMWYDMKVEINRFIKAISPKLEIIIFKRDE